MNTRVHLFPRAACFGVSIKVGKMQLCGRRSFSPVSNLMCFLRVVWRERESEQHVVVLRVRAGEEAV